MVVRRGPLRAASEYRATRMLMATDLHVIVLARAIAPLHGVGGLERHVHDLVCHLLKQGVQVTVITRPPSHAPAALTAHEGERLHVRFVPYWTFPFAGRRGTTVLDRSSAYPWFGWRAGRVAARLVERGGIQIVHGHGASALGYARARRRNWLGTVPLVFNLEEFGATDPSRAPLKRIGYRPLQAVVRACARDADRVIATDRALLPVVLRHLSVGESKVRVVPNAIDLGRVDGLAGPRRAGEVRARHGLSGADLVLVGVGRLEENKGFQYLVGALARLSAHTSPLGDRWRCVLLGDGPYRGRLEREIEAARLASHILLPGRVSDDELHAWYEAATLFVHPTLYEGSSIVTLEAMAHRRAIVATTAGGLPDKVHPGVNGWLVEPGDAGALAAAIADALSDSQRLARMGDASRALVEREFSWDVVITRVLALYEEVLAGSSS
jgi:glycogen(starch) synthase